MKPGMVTSQTSECYIPLVAQHMFMCRKMKEADSSLDENAFTSALKMAIKDGAALIWSQNKPLYLVM
jgi:hypothetical protein